MQNIEMDYFMHTTPQGMDTLTMLYKDLQCSGGCALSGYVDGEEAVVTLLARLGPILQLKTYTLLVKSSLKTCSVL